MEAEERPNKIRRLDADHNCARSVASVAEKQTVETTSADALKEKPAGGDIDSAKAGRNDLEYGIKEREVSLPAPEQTAPAIMGVPNTEDEPPLSKSKLKKLRKKAEWEAKRPERKALKKAKLQAKRERKREEKQQEAEANPEAALQIKTSQPPPRQFTQLPITFLIDCDFDDLMLDGERISLATQITRSYSDNKNASYRAHLTLCSFGGELRKRFDNVLTHYKNWKGLRTFDGDFVETVQRAKEWMGAPQGGKLAGVFSKYAELGDDAKDKLMDQGEIVYLTSEAEEDLTELKPYSTYIIGGLVDKNREKGICFKRAKKRNVRTAKLPIGEYMDMSSRKVLATNHVNEIMLKWLECGDWGEAFVQVIPKRKGGKLKGSEEESKEMSDETGGDDDRPD